MAKPSTSNPEKLFKFTINRLTKLKPLVEALYDPEFSSRGDNAAENGEHNATALKEFHFTGNTIIPALRQTIRRKMVKKTSEDVIYWLPDIFEAIPTQIKLKNQEYLIDLMKRNRRILLDNLKKNQSIYSPLKESIVPKEISTSICSRFQRADKILFQFRVAPLTKFKLAMEALSDRDFNPVGFGRMEVAEKGVDFRARNVNTKVTGFLRLNSTALKDFEFSRRCKDKLMRVNFRIISQIITDADNNNEESITLFHFDGSDNIIINLGSDPVKEIKVKLFHKEKVILVPMLDKYPDIKFFREPVIPSYSLREMLDRLKSLGKNQLVEVDIIKTIVTVLMGDNLQPWVFDDKAIRGMSLGQNYHAWFKWPHLEMLKKASHVAPAFPLCFLTEPEDMIMTRFTLRELGDLVFTNRATNLQYNDPP